MESYVYTLSAARSRLKRGHKSVLVFQPYTAKLIRFTLRNWKTSKKKIKYLKW